MTTIHSSNSESTCILGCLAGAAQSIVATPLDSLKVRFEVSDLLEGKHKSMYQFAKSTLKELGIASAYRGFTLTLIRVKHFNKKKGVNGNTKFYLFIGLIILWSLFCYI